MNALMNKIMLSCKKASELVEKHSVFPLTTMEKIQLKMHTSMCSACRAFQSQSQQIDDLLDQQLRQSEPMEKAESEKLKSSILTTLKKK